jgi:hypothetical protein
MVYNGYDSNAFASFENLTATVQFQLAFNGTPTDLPTAATALVDCADGVTNVSVTNASSYSMLLECTYQNSYPVRTLFAYFW